MIPDMSRMRKAWRYLRQNGVRKTMKRLRQGQPVDLVRRYEYINLPGVTPRPAAPQSSRVINWYLTAFSGASGGSINIFRFARELETHGYICNIVLVQAQWMSEPGLVKDAITREFGAMSGGVYIGYQNAPPAAAGIATGFQTAYFLRASPQEAVRFYFVQDFEPHFFAQGSDYAIAEKTYTMGMIGLTAGQWLADKLQRDFNMKSHAVGFSFDRNLYGPRSIQRVVGRKRVFFYGRPETERRAFEIGVLVLNLLCQRRNDVEVVFAGGDLGRYEFGFPSVSMGMLRMDQLADVYAGCDAALVLSMTNASLLPLEIMACGTPVVSNNGPHVEWLLNQDVAALAPLDVEALAHALERALYDDAYSQTLKQKGSSYAQSTSWQREGELMARHLRDCGCSPGR